MPPKKAARAQTRVTQRPAPPAAKSELVREIEVAARDLYAARKIVHAEGVVAAADYLIGLDSRPGADDPSAASARAIVSVQLLDEKIAHSQKFLDGRKPGTVGPIRKAIASLLRHDPRATNATLWDVIRSKPPRGWQACENSTCGKYIEGPWGADMGYRRFCNVCAEERRKFTG